MPLLKPSISNKINATVTLERSTIEKLDLYAAYTKTNADAVLNAALEHVFAKDREFQEYCDKHPGAVVASLRVTTAAKGANRTGVARKMRGSAPTSDVSSVQ